MSHNRVPNSIMANFVPLPSNDDIGQDKPKVFRHQYTQHIKYSAIRILPGKIFVRANAEVKIT